MNIQKDEPRLLDKICSKVRLKGYSSSTEKIYSYWAKRYILFHDKRHPSEMGAKEVEEFLSYLTSKENVSSSTQNQSLCALIFSYKYVIEQPFESPIKALKAKKYNYIPTVLTIEETHNLFNNMSGTMRLIAELTYGSGTRLSETHNLRIQDIDFSNKRIVVRDGKGRKDRFAVLPDTLIKPLQAHLLRVKQLHKTDLTSGHGASVLPTAYARRMSRASKDFIWQFVFPSNSLFHDENTGISRRWHLNTSTFQKCIQKSARTAGIMRRVSPHMLISTQN